VSPNCGKLGVSGQLKPHRLERYVRSTDPDVETKAADIIGLYLNPPAQRRLSVRTRARRRRVGSLDQAL
jgi:hypothetical protein